MKWKQVKKNKWKIFWVVVCWLFVVAVWQSLKPLPENISYHGPARLGDVGFLYDYTSGDFHDQEIFDTIFSHIDNANDYILIDMFLFNPYIGSANSSYRGLSEELTQHLIAKKQQNPEVKIDFITDPINNVYGGDYSEQIRALQDAGVNVIITDLAYLRDSNPLYSPVWRTFIQWFGNSEHLGILPNPFVSGAKVTFRTYFSLLNFKANHRKTFLADTPDGWVSIVMSANPHDGSSAHSNVAFQVRGKLAEDLLTSEQAVAGFSKGSLQFENLDAQSVGSTMVELLTEERIRDELIAQMDTLQDGDELQIAMFYLADRKIVKAILDASERGVDVSLVLDPNKDAFGHQKNGVPNRPVAHELVTKSGGKIKVRWYNTQGEQFHTKLIYMKSDKVIIILGSANLTKRNLGNLNLETDVKVETAVGSSLDLEIQEYLDRVEEGTVDYQQYEDGSLWHTFLYRFQEWSGLSSF